MRVYYFTIVSPGFRNCWLYGRYSINNNWKNWREGGLFEFLLITFIPSKKLYFFRHIWVYKNNLS